jgi:glutamate--cysteine ligase
MMLYKIHSLVQLEQFAAHNWRMIQQYLEEWQGKLPMPLYSSVDIREGEFKMAPIDNNLYPAGFNNLCEADLEASSIVLKQFLEKYFPNKKVKTIGLLPESNTKNLFYLDHLYMLKKVIEQAGYQVICFTLDRDYFDGQEERSLISHSGYSLVVKKGIVKADKVVVEGGDEIDFIIMNHDQSIAFEIDWTSLKTPIYPTPHLGWYKRDKIVHFEHYEKVLTTFCDYFSIDPKLMMAQFTSVRGVDFSKKEGLELLSQNIDELKATISPKANIFIKASQGTYGMGIMTVNSGKEILEINRKDRNKMDIGKNHKKFTSFLIQEGVETVLKHEGMSAEITIYLIGGVPVGGFQRVNPLKGPDENLNSKGMVFLKYCLSDIKDCCEGRTKEALYSLLAQLSSMATAYEILGATPTLTKTRE